MAGATKKSYRDLKVWQEACALAVNVYRVSSDFPKPELYGMTSQVRRAAASIPANIAEGKARRSEGDFVRFLRIAAGSLAELETFLELARRLEFATPEALVDLEDQAGEVSRMLYGLIGAITKPR